MAVYVATHTLPCVRTFGHITASHIAVVLRLPAADQERVLSWAEAERLSVRELRRHVVTLRRTNGERRGRPSDEGRRILALTRSSLENMAAAEDHLQGAPLDETAREAFRGMLQQLLALSTRLLRDVDSDSAGLGSSALRKVRPVVCNEKIRVAGGSG